MCNGVALVFRIPSRLDNFLTSLESKLRPWSVWTLRESIYVYIIVIKLNWFEYSDKGDVLSDKGVGYDKYQILRYNLTLNWLALPNFQQVISCFQVNYHLT